jgi:uncharacterized protein YkwD
MPAVFTPRRMRAIACAAVALVAGTAVLLTLVSTRATSPDQCPVAGAAPTAGTLGQASGAVVCLVNAERAQAGLPPLRANRALDRAAGRHSRDMVRRAFFAHVSPSGSNLKGRLRRSGYIQGKRAWHVGEDLAWGSGTNATPDMIVAGWMASPAHRRILLGKDFREVGVGVAAGAPEPTGELTGTTYTLDAGVMSG